MSKLIFKDVTPKSFKTLTKRTFYLDLVGHPPYNLGLQEMKTDSYHEQNESAQLEKIEFEFPESGILVLVGENNAGKSNIIRAIDLICGEAWIGKEKLEDHDYYLRNKANNIKIDLFFDSGNSVQFNPDNGKWGVQSYDDWSQQSRNYQFQIKESYPST